MLFLFMRQNINIIMINVINERVRFFNMCETVFISIDSIMISISIFVVKYSDHKLFSKRFFQRAARIDSINMNDKLFEIILHSLNKKKRVSFLKISVEYVNNKEKSLCSQ